MDVTEQQLLAHIQFFDVLESSLTHAFSSVVKKKNNQKKGSKGTQH